MIPHHWLSQVHQGTLGSTGYLRVTSVRCKEGRSVELHITPGAISNETSLQWGLRTRGEWGRRL